MLLRKIQQRLDEESLARKYLQEQQRLLREIEKKLEKLEELAAENGKWKSSWLHEVDRLEDFKQSLKADYKGKKKFIDAIKQAKTNEELLHTMVDAEFDQYNSLLAKELTADLVSVYIDETEWTRRFLEENFAGGRVQFQFSRQVNEKVVKQLIKGSTITNSKGEAKTLYQYLTSYSVQSAEVCENIIKTGISLGDSVQNSVSLLRKELPSIAKYRLETTVRTWTIKTHTDANLDTYREADIKRVQWCSALDLRVCVRCAALDGKVFILSRMKKKPPLHPNCRCCLTPLVDNNDIFDSKEDGYRAWLSDGRRSRKDLISLRKRVLREKGIKKKEKDNLLNIIDQNLRR